LNVWICKLWIVMWTLDSIYRSVHCNAVKIRETAAQTAKLVWMLCVVYLAALIRRRLWHWLFTQLTSATRPRRGTCISVGPSISLKSSLDRSVATMSLWRKRHLILSSLSVNSIAVYWVFHVYILMIRVEALPCHKSKQVDLSTFSKLESNAWIFVDCITNSSNKIHGLTTVTEKQFLLIFILQNVLLFCFF